MNNRPYERHNRDKVFYNETRTTHHSNIDQCECSDTGCPVHKGQDCNRKGDNTLYRIDMTDLTGTRFCYECGQDAFESGLFTDDNEPDDADETDAGWQCPSCETRFDSPFLDTCPICRGRTCERVTK